jgi:hypothetical protein
MTDVSVTFANATSRITGTDVDTNYSAGDTIEVSNAVDSGNNKCFLITGEGSGYVTTSVAPDDESNDTVTLTERPTICIVDDLTDNNETLANGTRNGIPVKLGSFRECYMLDHDNKIIMFEVSGNIDIVDRLISPCSYTHIAGQTAPYPGVTLTRCNLGNTSGEHDYLVEHLRIRSGDYTDNDDGCNTRNAIEFGASRYNLVVDHCSFSWAPDTNVALGTTNGYNSTLSNCIVAEGLEDSCHTTSNHGFGMNASNSYQTSILRNAFINNYGRNPMYNTDTGGTPRNAYIANNLTYHARLTPGRINLTNAAAEIDYVENLVLSNPNESNDEDDQFMFLVNPYSSSSSFFISNNKVEALTQSADDNWDLVRVPIGETTYTYANYGVAAAQNAPTGYTLLGISNVESHVLASAGARPAERDTIDSRLITEVQETSGDTGWPDWVEDDTVGGTQVPEKGYPDLEENRRNLATGMTVDTLQNIPADPYADNSDDGYTASNDYSNLEEWLVILAEFVEAGPPAPVGDCGFLGTYAGAWSGDYSGDTDEWCLDSGASSADGTPAAGITIHGDYKKTGTYGVLFDAASENITWTMPTDVNSSEGTVWVYLYVVASTGTNNFFKLYKDADDEIYARYGADGRVYLVHEHGGTITGVFSTGSPLTDSAWNLVGLRWSVANDKLSIKVNGDPWIDDNDADAVAAFDTGEPTVVILGAQNTLAVDDSYWADEFSIYATYDAGRALSSDGDPGPSISSATSTSVTYRTGDSIPLTFIWSEEPYYDPATPTNVVIEGGPVDPEFHQSSKNGEVDSWICDACPAGARSTNMDFLSTIITAAVEDIQGTEASSYSVPASIAPNDNTVILECEKGANDPWLVQRNGGDAATLAGLISDIGYLVPNDVVVMKGVVEATATVTESGTISNPIIFYIYSLTGDLDVGDKDYVTIRGTNRVSGNIVNTGGTGYSGVPYNPPMMSN